MLKSFLYLVAFVAIAAPLVRAQTTSIIEGTVTDQQGLPIVGADVRIVGAEMGIDRRVLSASDGIYRVPGLPVGHLHCYRFQERLCHKNAAGSGNNSE